jgi:predicted HicB family RNase H-like nuclease
MTEIDRQTERETHEKIYQAAYSLYCQNPDWVSFFRDILGREGIVRVLCPNRDSLAEFERSSAYTDIQQMLTRLRERSVETATLPEPTRVITVRLPKSLHDALRAEAHDHRTSMNKLCISKLLQFIDNQFVPSDT